MSLSADDLTDAQEWRLRHPNLVDRVNDAPGIGPQTVTCQNCGHTWDYTGERHIAQCSKCRHETPLAEARAGDLTQPMCNAIREAARDGLQYDAIADLFGFVSGKRVANDHATGRCSHTGGVEPADRRRRSTSDVTAAECADLRSAYRDGASVTDLDRQTNRDEATIYRHVVGACSH